jgi:outer membrane protein OmpA-like peptidoglycan-associated protein
MSPRIKLLNGVLVLLAVLALSIGALAQDQQPSKVDIFAGYSWLNPGGKINGTEIKSISKGYTVATTYWLNRYGGIELSSGGHFGNSSIGTIQVGPAFRFPGENVTLFAHGLVGGHLLNAPAYKPDWGIGLTGGGGIDLDFTRVVSLRIFEADYQYAHHNLGPSSGSVVPLARFDTSGWKLSGGLVFHFGTIGPPPPPPAAACTVQPTEVFEGEPVTATATGSNFNPKRTVTYKWSGTGVNVSGEAQTAQIDTKGLQPGQYTVTSHLTDGKKAMADCSANFTVKAPQPPTISCTANPTAVDVGGSCAISCNASSPQGRNVTVTHQASGGNITGEGANVTLNTTGATPGALTVTSTATDDRNLTATTTTTCTVNAPAPAPPPPAAPTASQLNSINFKKNSPRVDNAAKAVLDDVALRLQRDADSKLVIIGGTDPSERSKTLAAQRASNTKAYLVKEKGIDASRISIRTGGQGMTATMWIVPAGAAEPTEGTPVTERPTPTRKPRAKAKAAAPAPK